jgi:hypothetical protein
VPSSRVVSAVLAFLVAAVPLAPAQHVHDAVESDGHHQILAHTHAEAHHLEIHSGHSKATVDDEDSVILTMDPVFALPHGYVSYALPPGESPRLTLALPLVRRFTATAFVDHPIHGPPRAPSVLRGPPPSSFL